MNVTKTDHQHTLVEWLVNHQGEVVGVFDLENAGGKTVRRIAGKFANKPFHRPDGNFTQDELIGAVNVLNGKIKLYSSDGERDWDSIKEAIRGMAACDGVTYFFIDPLTALISMMDSSSANDALNLIMTELASMCQELDVTFFLYSHVNPPARGGKPHEEGGKVLSSQFTGSRAMEKWAHYGWGIERDRLSEDEDVRNTSTFRLLFDREFGNTAKFPVYYDHEKGTYLEPELDDGHDGGGEF